MTAAIEVLLNAGGEHGGWWWPLALLFWAAVVAAVVWFVMRRRRPSGPDRAKEILAERFARGEVSAEEYRERLAEL